MSENIVKFQHTLGGKKRVRHNNEIVGGWLTKLTPSALKKCIYSIEANTLKSSNKVYLTLIPQLLIQIEPL